MLLPWCIRLFRIIIIKPQCSIWEFYPRFSLPLFLPQSRGLPSVSPHHYVIAPDSKSSERVLFTHVVFTPCKHCHKQFHRDSILERSNMQRIMVARIRNICSMRHRIHPERGADAALGRRLLGNLHRPSKRLAIFPRMRRRIRFTFIWQTLLFRAAYNWGKQQAIQLGMTINMNKCQLYVVPVIVQNSKC